MEPAVETAQLNRIVKDYLVSKMQLIYPIVS